ncbi:MAG: ABC transporter permease [Acidobacteria bacterium]|nr:ABC transporter permease [Acidobacteriota bacterium]MCA1608143.1 ABC transporter permease [Acidobacteriota bacterium]
MTHETQITKIEPRASWPKIDFKELWRHRELFYFLAWRDVTIRYRQTLIGVFWAVLQPVLTTAIFTVLFSRLAQFDTGGVPYPLFALSGLVVWLFIHSSITTASNSFIGNTNLVTKIYFPRLIVPIAAVAAAVLDMLIGLATLGVVMIYYKAVPSPALIFAPVFIISAVILAASLGILLSAVNVRFRDVKFALPFALQVWMIASPIFYPISILSEKWRLIFAVNPVTGIIEGLRSALFGVPFDLSMILISHASLIFVVIISLFIFSSMEDDFADLI